MHCKVCLPGMCGGSRSRAVLSGCLRATAGKAGGFLSAAWSTVLGLCRGWDWDGDLPVNFLMTLAICDLLPAKQNFECVEERREQNQKEVVGRNNVWLLTPSTHTPRVEKLPEYSCFVQVSSCYEASQPQTELKTLLKVKKGKMSCHNKCWKSCELLWLVCKRIKKTHMALSPSLTSLRCPWSVLFKCTFSLVEVLELLQSFSSNRNWSILDSDISSGSTFCPSRKGGGLVWFDLDFGIRQRILLPVWFYAWAFKTLVATWPALCFVTDWIVATGFLSSLAVGFSFQLCKDHKRVRFFLVFLLKKVFPYLLLISLSFLPSLAVYSTI